MAELIDLPLVYSGKVRDIYDAGDDRLLMVTSDRMSAFDVVMAQPIPNKGRVLTATSAYWFAQLRDVVGSHLISTDVSDLPESVRAKANEIDLAGRFMLCRKAQMLPVECIVRGYLAGSAYKEYRSSRTMHGVALPDGMVESQALDEPVFTPSTKAALGIHDENISFAQAEEIVGSQMATRLRDVSLELYRRGSALAAQRGVIIADTKFEFGLLNGELVLCDEVLTPDSSRFWDETTWQPGTTPPSYDKQPLRDYLDGLDWNKTPPPPTLPDEVVQATQDRYVRAYERVTGLAFADWPGVTAPAQLPADQR